MRAGIAFGSNLGDRLANLKAGRAEVVSLPGVELPVVASGVYETEPVDCAPGTREFLNAVMEIGYPGAGEELLRELRNIEKAHGRPTAHERNAPRTLDLDLLYFGGVQISQPGLQLPHPRMLDRRFVLEPLAEIRPELILPGESVTVAELLRRLPDATALVKFASEW
ncbi:MAG: 2-amino-4-hydroxy-6-hydroxymethyldihydropteridine diphosphokinase [Verrucomicrobiota bacterium]|nr:2-amino-4-hydroxy-6-hydroxymethyldihydropteridine diphosphokinase [Verrucomicrobiota bacterium]MDQ6939584.1 2-amino-4-hydroxy-6-hydroxymethyldihydropteridine diphosphokinase [Verrucomicrobiota bacterium]